MWLLQYTASLPGGGGQRNSWNAQAHQLGGRRVQPRRRSVPKERYSCNALPHHPGAVGSATPAMHCLIAEGQWAVWLLQCNASLPGGVGQQNSCNTLPHCLGSVGSGTPAMRRPTSWGRRRRRRSACRGPTYGEPWRRPPGAPRRHSRGSPPSYLR